MKNKGGFELKKFISLVLVFMLLITIMGCSKKEEVSMEMEKTEEKTEEKAEEKTEEIATEMNEEESVYPLENVEFTYWARLNNNLGQTATNLGETPFAKELSKETGVTIEYLHPAANQHKEIFNLMVASGELTDIFEHNIHKNYNGGPEKAISDGVIVDLTEYLPKFAPNLMKYYEENPEIAKLAKTDTGKLYNFPFIKNDASLMTNFGPIVNGKWLEDLGLEYPETIDEWYTMLTRFKNEKGAIAPLTYEPWMILSYLGSPFVGAFGISEDFYLDEQGKVQFGSMQPEYKKFLETFSQWYAEGLLDPDVETMNGQQVAAKMTSGESGASLGYVASSMGTWIGATEGNPDYSFIGVKYPVLNKGDLPKFTHKDAAIPGSDYDAYISTNCEDIESAVRYLDFAYSEAGRKLFNYGIENVSYTMVDGYPTYTDTILKNPDLTSAEALALYARSNYSGPFVQEKEYVEQYAFVYEQQREAVERWKITDMDKYNLPNITPTPEESEEVSAILNEVMTYRDEMQVKYIMGVEDLASYDTYVQNIKDMGIDRVLEIYEAALIRYRNR